ncbi:AAA family ATPase [Chryseobacterium soli]|uniref:AAA family ATPase n=1 Tax=Chryseobacterium soli TaxID=445961 RepID=UPI0029542BB5|nr:AAA family ATPase [Chryseobacterium soli]MDV7698254.1 AAA family ATPase [Chryseobacterium soli]
MITRIELNQIATYKNPVEINDLKKVNFFFGNNGCGKSTIARLFYNYSQNEILLNQFKNCSINGFNRSEEEIIVFDSDFIQNNFYLNPELSGIFSLDEKNEEIDKNIKTEYQNLADIEKSISDKIEERQKLETSKNKDYENILEDCWTYNKQFQKDFNKINLGKRRDPFFESLVEINQTEYSYKNLNLISEKYKKCYLGELNKIESNISVNNFDMILDFEKEFNNALEEIIIGSNDVPIASIINQLNNSSWIAQGINFLDKDKEVQGCPFCQQQTINKNLLNQFEKYFDTTREQKIKNLQELHFNYKSKISAFEYSLKALIDKELVKFDVLKIQNKLSNILTKNEKEIQAKIDNPNEKKKIETLEFLKTEIEKVNENIRVRNEEVDNIEQSQQELTDEIWKYISHQVKDKINSFKTTANNNSEQIKKLKTEIKVFEVAKIDSNDKIRDWQNQTINTQKSVDNINDLLLKNNFTGFRIEKKESENNIIKYYILREGETSENHVFKTLSEGEKNFIAFLYFYQLCLGTNDTENSTKKKIIVIDDPVSSMDSQVLFFVSTLIRKLIAPRGGTGGGRVFKNENIEQVFVLTHNSYFFKEVSFHQRLLYKDEVLFKKISKKNNKTLIEDIGYSNINDYGLLWREIKMENSEKITISLLNNMRRIIESYSNFMGYINGSNLWSLLNSLDLDEESIEYLVYISFLSNINDESHKVSINDEMFYNRLCEESRQIAMDSFKLFFEKLNASSHYEMMIEIC